MWRVIYWRYFAGRNPATVPAVAISYGEQGFFEAYGGAYADILYTRYSSYAGKVLVPILLVKAADHNPLRGR